MCARAAGAFPSLKGSAALGHVMIYLRCSVVQRVAMCENALHVLQYASLWLRHVMTYLCHVCAGRGGGS